MLGSPSEQSVLRSQERFESTQPTTQLKAELKGQVHDRDLGDEDDSHKRKPWWKRLFE